MPPKIDRTGETFINKEGYSGKIVKYVNNREVYIVFDDDNTSTLIKCLYSSIVNKTIKYPNNPTYCGLGYIGYGNYPTLNEDGTVKKEFELWRRMLYRCSEHYQNNRETYKGVKCCDYFKSYQNFAKWFEDNYYEVEGERMHLDKDWLVKGNKIYSPETCVFVPHSINGLIVGNDKNRGDTPIGVSKLKNFYRARLKKQDHEVHLGLFDSPVEAFKIYKKAKEQHIKQVAEEYKDKIPMKLYEAMYSYEVEITD